MTDGDLRRAIAKNISTKTKLERIMNRKVFFVEKSASPSEILTRAAAKIRAEGWHKNRLNKIVVVDQDRRVLNVVSLFDLWQASDIRFKRIGVVGLGYVGLTLSLTLADLGFEVLGSDIDPAIRRIISKAQAPFYEAGLDRLLKDHINQRFKIVLNFAGKNQCDVYFIAVGTPLNTKQRPQLEHLEAAASALGNVIKQGDVVILRSTVPLGTTREVVVPILEKRSGLVAGEDFSVAFAPERTVEGKALEELRNLPQVIGGLNRASANQASSIFNLMTDTVFIVDTPEEAEMVKLINNTYRDVTFAFANEVALVCQKWGMDTNKVVNAANLGYPRSQIPKPSPGVGGYCLEKDPFIFIESGRSRGYEPRLAREARIINQQILKAVAEDTILFFRKTRNKNPVICILGFAFKGDPPTSDMRGSPTLKLVQILRKRGLKRILGYDPQVDSKDLRVLKVEPVLDLKKVLPRADAIIVMTNHPYFKGLDMRSLLAAPRTTPLFFYDTWALYSGDELKKVKGVVYKRL